MDRLHRIGQALVDAHVHRLDEKRREDVLFKRVNIDGNTFGRAFRQGSGVHVRCQRMRYPFRLLVAEEKRGNNAVYYKALRSLTAPCNDECGRRYCAYCRLTASGHRLPDASVPRLAYVISRPLSQWGTFREENNFAPTKMVIRLLHQDRRFLRALLQEGLLLHTVPTLVAPPLSAPPLSETSIIVAPTIPRSRPDLLILGIVTLAVIGISVVLVGGPTLETVLLWGETLM